MRDLKDFIRMGDKFGSNIGNEWKTPNNIFKKLNQEFNFTVDLAADDNNHKCKKYYTKHNSGLNADLTNEIIFCNPPFSKIEPFFKKIKNSNYKKAVFLTPFRANTKYFLKYVYSNVECIEIRLLILGVKFLNTENQTQARSPFPICLLIFDKNSKTNKKTFKILDADTLTILENINTTQKQGRPQKLTSSDILKIKKMLTKKIRQQDIAKKYNVSISTIKRIKKGS